MDFYNYQPVPFIPVPTWIPARLGRQFHIIKEMKQRSLMWVPGHRLQKNQAYLRFTFEQIADFLRVTYPTITGK